jgi:hypothetical protein
VAEQCPNATSGIGRPTSVVDEVVRRQVPFPYSQIARVEVLSERRLSAVGEITTGERFVRPFRFVRPIDGSILQVAPAPRTPARRGAS